MLEIQFDSISTTKILLNLNKYKQKHLLIQLISLAILSEIQLKLYNQVNQFQVELKILSIILSNDSITKSFNICSSSNTFSNTI